MPPRRQTPGVRLTPGPPPTVHEGSRPSPRGWGRPSPSPRSPDSGQSRGKARETLGARPKPDRAVWIGTLLRVQTPFREGQSRRTTGNLRLELAGMHMRSHPGLLDPATSTVAASSTEEQGPTFRVPLRARLGHSTLERKKGDEDHNSSPETHRPLLLGCCHVLD